MNAALVFVSIMNVNHGLAPRNMNLAIATRNAALAFAPELMSVGHFKQPWSATMRNQLFVARSI